MLKSIKIGDELFHKHLDIVIVTDIGESSIKVNTKRNGILDFNNYELGKALYFDKEHKVKIYSTYMEYLEFYEKEKLLKIEMENIEQQNLILKIKQEEEKELEKKLDFERERQFRITQAKERKALSLIEKRKLMKWYNDRIIQKIKGDQETKIKEILEHRKIKSLIHFTRIENLSSILKYGIVPVSKHSVMNISSMRNDHNRIDGHLDCTSISIEFPNYKLFQKFRDYQYSSSKWVIIIINTDILLSSANLAYYYFTNAASSLSKTKVLKELCTADSLEEMFCDVITTKGNGIVKRIDLEIDDNYTTDPQAEILISDIIDPKYIDSIYFNNNIDIDKYISENGVVLLNKFEYGYNPTLFNYRKDFMYW